MTAIDRPFIADSSEPLLVAAGGAQNAHTPLEALPPKSHKSAAKASKAADSPGDSSAALLHIYSRAAGAADLSTALLVLVNELQAWLGCDMFCLTLATARGDMRVVAMSRVATFDRQSSLNAALEEAARETMLLGRAGVFPAPDGASAVKNLAELCRQSGSPRARVFPCKDANGTTVAVCVVLSPENLPDDDSRLTCLSQSADSLGVTLQLLRRAHESLTRRAARGLRGAFGAFRRSRYVALGAIFVAILAFAPWPYHLPCECVVEPVIRRFVSAPFDAVLDRTLVRPGDRVSAGDVLAMMDGRELRMQLASRRALLDQSRQRYTAALAKRDAAAAQLALMEVRQSEQEVALLERRQQNLAIRSPLAGIVVSGDLHRAAGAPLTVGQKLFEIAPLDQMVVEASVPEDQVGAIHEGQPVALSLESHPGVHLRGTVIRLHPQAELRNQKNVFVAEVQIDDDSVSLLPGMSGQARVDVGTRSVGWILFHRPWHYLRSKLVW